MDPFTTHWYNGADPPFVTDAEKVTVLPSQNGLVDAEMFMVAGRAVVTCIVSGFEVAGLPYGQVALEVSLHVMMSPLVGVHVKVGLFRPCMLVPTFH